MWQTTVWHFALSVTNLQLSVVTNGDNTEITRDVCETLDLDIPMINLYTKFSFQYVQPLQRKWTENDDGQIDQQTALAA